MDSDEAVRKAATNSTTPTPTSLTVPAPQIASDAQAAHAAAHAAATAAAAAAAAVVAAVAASPAPGCTPASSNVPTVTPKQEPGEAGTARKGHKARNRRTEAEKLSNEVREPPSLTSLRYA